MLRKQSFALLLALVLCLSLSAAAYAADSTGTLAHVTDMAGILSADQVRTLDSSADSLSREYGCGIYIVVLEDYHTFTSGSIAQCGEELFEYFSLGEGLSRNCLLLVMSMKERDFDITAHGDVANEAFTDYGKELLEDAFIPDFRQNDWYSGFRHYLNAVENELESARNGSPVDVPYEEPERLPTGIKALLAACGGGLTSLVTLAGFKSQMKTAKRKTDAEDYVVRGSANLRIKEDQFLNTTRTVHVIQRNNSSGGGHHGGTTVNSGGFSHHSGKF